MQLETSEAVGSTHLSSSVYSEWKSYHTGLRTKISANTPSFLQYNIAMAAISYELLTLVLSWSNILCFTIASMIETKVAYKSMATSAST